MIDEMVEILKKEQQDDDHKKEYCAEQFDQSEDTKKALERKVADEEHAIAAAEEGIATLTEEIAALEAAIKALDKSVAEATEQRKAENAEFKELMASNSAAKEIIGLAKNRMMAFYNKKLHKAAPKAELTREDRIVANLGGAMLAQVSAYGKRRADPGPPPASWSTYEKKSEESSGVVEMMNLLIKDLDKEMTEAETGEKDAQADYELMMKDAAETRAAD